MIVGIEAYSRYGNFLKTNTVPLTRSNVFARVATFWRVMQMKGEEIPTGVYVMRQIILKMIHSRRYSPGPDWLTPQYGKGLNIDKTFSALKMLTRPELTTKWDVDLVFFDDGRRLTPETFHEFCASEHATECIGRGGPCSTRPPRLFGVFATFCQPWICGARHPDIAFVDADSLRATVVM